MEEDEKYEFIVESVDNGRVYKSGARFVDVEDEDLDGDTLVYKTVNNHVGNLSTVIAGYQVSEIHDNGYGKDAVEVSKVPEQDQNKVKEIMEELDAEEPFNIN